MSEGYLEENQALTLEDKAPSLINQDSKEKPHVLVPDCHGRMLGHNTMRVLTSFRIVFLTFNIYFRYIISNISKGATVMIVHAIALYYIAFCFVDLAPGYMRKL